VLAQIGQLQGLSAHGDADDLCRFLSCQDSEKVKAIFLVHGEYKVQQAFASRLEIKGFKKVEIPAHKEEFALITTEADIKAA
jgi:metallo-beta-lactamase family protein